MRFGPVPLADALGAIAAHTVRAGDLVLRKGTLIEPAHVAALSRAGVGEITVARLDDGDISEDLAAIRIAAACAGDGVVAADPFTGRANLHARHGGVVELDPAAVDAFNAVDEALTIATVPAFRPVEAGGLVATIKVIPYAVPTFLVETALRRALPVVRVAPFRRGNVAVLSTLLPGLPGKVVEKTLRITAARLARYAARVSADIRIPHEEGALREAILQAVRAGAEAVMVFGASAIADRRDVIPAALEAAGGRVERLGMPVDPGNLLMLGRLGDVPVLGAPGCARSPKENGLDFVLARLLADLPVRSADIARMGAGGLIGEIVTRPQPREEPPEREALSIAALVLAAGRGTRMGGPNKLLELVGGRPVVRRVVEAALAGEASPVIVVTGHDGARVRTALDGLPVQFVENPDYAAGLSTSLAVGVRTLPERAQGALVMLGDMPLVDEGVVRRLLEGFAPDQGRLIVVPVSEGRRGNPVLWSRRFFPALAAIEGDVGARAILAAHAEAVAEIEVFGPGTLLDVDTPEALTIARGLAASESLGRD